MNSSQLLYKISNLQYDIRMKEVEYMKAVNARDQLNIDLNSAALATLKGDLAASVKEFNTIPAHNAHNNNEPQKKVRWWQSFFNLKPATNTKS